MKQIKEKFIFGFAIFASFFGAGNLILPPMLGFKAGEDWWLVGIGFLLSATIFPMLALLGYARLQGNMIDFGKKVSTRFAFVFSVAIYLMIPILPTPRTAAVTHEIAIQPYFESSALLTSFVYFLLVFLFVINRGKVIEFLGKFLTPIIGLILLAVILMGILGPENKMMMDGFESPMIKGFLEGYQTYDAIAGLVMGGVMVVTLNNSREKMSVGEKQKMIGQSGLIAMAGLFIIYIGLIFIGSRFNAAFDPDISRTALLSGLSTEIMGKTGTAFLSILVALSCFTTAVSIIVGVADFFKEMLGGSQKVYVASAALSCVAGILMGQFEVKFIIDLAVSVLMLLYPISIVLILLNLLPEKYAGRPIYRVLVILAIFFSIPNFMSSILSEELLNSLYSIIPLSKEGLGWVMPCILAFILMNLIPNKRKVPGIQN
ncbi:branched-chain amino acid transport system II carrier protein [Lutimonas zeaxanthinifaciens]|uniref:branched-chain amino acid transport system II carrier protein n=1 Tax=Lutimonas zeaxanthinifaciens TaxID=3060215 RepID=UPI00265D6011|nr:branched-chain amino acid transport system II carrier protein [Lutimonas sp. YSD2104]WKK66411.1 branched-chain amino acid transport system II carrier protein [Lutimonas sp. YSD2104]